MAGVVMAQQDVADARQGRIPVLDSQALTVEEVLGALSTSGVFTLRLDATATELNKAVFEWFTKFDALPEVHKASFALDGNTTENDGWHGPGGLSKYNQYRTGYIFQASTPIPEMLEPGDGFAKMHEDWRQEIHALAARLIGLVAQGLGLPPSHFDRGEAFDIFTEAQLHVKRITFPASSALPKPDEEGRRVTLLAHRDPSVLSIVAHNEHGAGLQVYDEQHHTFHDVQQYGPEYCTVFAGTILSMVTNGLLKSARHRVANTEEEMRSMRIAGAFFFQPRMSCELRPFPVPLVSARGESSGRSRAMTYGEWKAKAYGKYYSRGSQGGDR